MVIEKLTESEMIMPYVMGQKINELIDAFNNHTHHSYDSYSSTFTTGTPVEEKESPPS